MSLKAIVPGLVGILRKILDLTNSTTKRNEQRLIEGTKWNKPGVAGIGSTRTREGTAGLGRRRIEQGGIDGVGGERHIVTNILVEVRSLVEKY